MSTKPSAARINELFDYDPETGAFTNKVFHPRRPVGSKVGTFGSHGYLAATVDGTKYLLHRMSWVIMTGEWPEGEVDHINKDRSDNRWSNLRPASRFDNSGNRLKNKNNTSGYKGVSWDKKRSKWIAGISKGRKYYCLGLFDDPVEAHQAYIAKAKVFFGDFASA